MSPVASMLTALLVALLAQAPVATPAVDHASVEVHALAPPRPVAVPDGRRYAAYELLITNYFGDASALRLIRVDVAAVPSGAALGAFEGGDLASRLVHPGRTKGTNGSGEPDPPVVGPGEHALLYLWVALPESGRAPIALRHRIAFRTTAGRERVVDGLDVAVSTDDVPAFGSPFRSGTWLTHEGPGAHRSHHWGSQLALNGRITIPQRFAIDFIGLDARGRAVRADVRTPDNANWIGFGAEVLAIDDGVVRDVQDGSADNVPLVVAGPPRSITARGLYGNYVVTESPRGFVHYAHLQRGSVRVHAGQRVRRGEPLGRVGNSGNTTGPHLHLHVSDRVTFELADGRPFVFAAVDVAGVTTADQALDPQASAAPLSSRPMRRVLPTHGTIVRFDAAAGGAR